MSAQRWLRIRRNRSDQPPHLDKAGALNDPRYVLSFAAFFASFLAFLGNPVFCFFTGLVPFFRPFLTFAPLTAEAILPATFPMVFAAVTRTLSAGSSCASFFFDI